MYCSTLKKAAVALALIGAVSSVSAKTTDFGTLNSGLTYSSQSLSGSFNDTLSFTVGSMTSLIGSFEISNWTAVRDDFSFALSVNYGPVPVIDTGWYSFLPTAPYDVIHNTFSYSQALGGSGSPLQLFAGETVKLRLAGNVLPGATSSYSFTLAPVPEPETYALMLAGLGLMGTIARRRRK